MPWPSAPLPFGRRDQSEQERQTLRCRSFFSRSPKAPQTSSLMLRTAILAALLVPAVTNTALSADRGCGSRGGPGYRGPNGRCVGLAGIGASAAIRQRPAALSKRLTTPPPKLVGLIKPTKTGKPQPHSATAGNARGDHGLVDHHLARLQLPLNPVVTQETIQATICVPDGRELFDRRSPTRTGLRSL